MPQGDEILFIFSKMYWVYIVTHNATIFNFNHKQMLVRVRLTQKAEKDI